MGGDVLMSRLKVKHSNPEGLFDSRVFSQVVTVSGNAKTIYIGGQNAINSEGQLIGRDNLELQTKQVLENINNSNINYTKPACQSFLTGITSIT